MLGALGRARGAIAVGGGLALGALGRDERAARLRERLGVRGLGRLERLQLGRGGAASLSRSGALGRAARGAGVRALELAARAQQRGLAARARAERDAAVGVVAEPVARDRDAARDAGERGGVGHEPDAGEQARRARARVRRTWAASGTAPAGAGAPSSARAADVQGAALGLGRLEQRQRGREIVGAGERGAALQRRGHGQLVAGLGLDERERERGAAAHELGQRGRDAVGALDRGGERIGAGRRGGGRGGGLGGAPLGLAHAAAQRVDLGAGAALGGERALVRGARRRGGGLGLGERRLGRGELGARALGCLPAPASRRSAIWALRVRCAASAASACAARPVSSAAWRRAASAASPLSPARAAAVASSASSTGASARLGGAQALGGLDRGLGLQRQARGLGGQPLGELALARGLGRDVGEALGQRVAARAQALDGRRQRDAVRGGGLLLAEDARELLLGLRAPRGDLGQARGGRVALGARGGELALALAARAPRLGQRGCEQAQAHLGDLPPERLGALGGGGLQLERLEARAQLALDVARALEIGGDAGELGLGALPAALELAEPGGLLDEARGARRAAPAAPGRRCPGR